MFDVGGGGYDDGIGQQGRGCGQYLQVMQAGTECVCVRVWRGRGLERALHACVYVVAYIKGKGPLGGQGVGWGGGG